MTMLKRVTSTWSPDATVTVDDPVNGLSVHHVIVGSHVLLSDAETSVTCEGCTVSPCDLIVIPERRYHTALTYAAQTRQHIQKTRQAQQDVILSLERDANRLRHEIRQLKRRQNRAPDALRSILFGEEGTNAQTVYGSGIVHGANQGLDHVPVARFAGGDFAKYGYPGPSTRPQHL